MQGVGWYLWWNAVDSKWLRKSCLALLAGLIFFVLCQPISSADPVLASYSCISNILGHVLIWLYNRLLSSDLSILQDSDVMTSFSHIKYIILFVSNASCCLSTLCIISMCVLHSHKIHYYVSSKKRYCYTIDISVALFAVMRCVY